MPMAMATPTIAAPPNAAKRVALSCISSERVSQAPKVAGWRSSASSDESWATKAARTACTLVVSRRNRAPVGQRQCRVVVRQIVSTEQRAHQVGSFIRDAINLEQGAQRHARLKFDQCILAVDGDFGRDIFSGFHCYFFQCAVLSAGVPLSQTCHTEPMPTCPIKPIKVLE